MAIETQTRPLLATGDRLSRADFHRLYELTPEKFRARLIDGVVYIDEDRSGMACPSSLSHGSPWSQASTWLGVYVWGTPGVGNALDATLILGPKNEPQPDIMAFLPRELGGTAWVEGEFLHGVPEFVIEIAVSSLKVDLGIQREDYERAGIPEYVVFAAKTREIHWHVLQEGRLQVVAPDPDGIYRSRMFPGLWLDPAAFWAEDVPGIRATLERGLASPEHAAFVARLRAAQPRLD